MRSGLLTLLIVVVGIFFVVNLAYYEAAQFQKATKAFAAESGR